jgi:hypothetical protein
MSQVRWRYRSVLRISSHFRPVAANSSADRT